MADVNTNLTNLGPALEQFIRRNLVPQYNRSSLTANLLRKEVGSGKNLAWDVVIGTSTGQAFSEAQQIVDFNADIEALATLPWAEYGDTFKITGRAEDASASSQTELGQAFIVKLGQAKERAAKRMNDDIWTGDGTSLVFSGLTMASNGPLSVSGTYANISRSANPQFAGITLANGGIPRAISQQLIQNGLEQVFNATGRQPDFGVTTSNIWRLLCELAGGDRRIMQEVYIRGQKLNIALGFEAVEINGIPVFKDISVPTGTLGFFNSDSISIEYLPTAPSRITRGKVMATIPLAGLPQEQDMTGVPAGAGIPIMANIIPLPASGNFEAWQLVATCGLKVTRPNSHLLIQDIEFRPGG